MQKIRYYHFVLFFGIILVFGLSYLVFIFLSFDTHIDVYPVEELNLKIVMNAIGNYYFDHGGLPPDESFRKLLAEYFEDDSILYEIKYFHQGDEFVLVSPGKNRKFDTPDGFKNIRDFSGESDDFILFSSCGIRQKPKSR